MAISSLLEDKFPTIAESGDTNELTIASSATEDAKGSWTEVFAATAAEWLSLTVQTTPKTSGDIAIVFFLDIGVGAAGSEVVTIPNIKLVHHSGDSSEFQFPIKIPAGSRIAARTANSNDSVARNITLNMQGFYIQ